MFAILVAGVVFTVLYYVLCAMTNGRRRKCIYDAAGNVIGMQAPSPMSLPIIGNLHNLAGYELPYQSFGALEKKFGPVISLQLGTQPALVVNGIENIKEVLIEKSAHFDSRPNFKRYHALFSGNKENSLAFCDWSDMQKMRRDMLVPHSFPRNFSLRFNRLNTMIGAQMQTMIGDIRTCMGTENRVPIKPIVLNACANVFTQYFCSRSFDAATHDGFARMIANFDRIFYEVNQGYLADFFPALLPIFHSRNLARMERCAHEIRDFILSDIIEDRKDTTPADPTTMDYVDCLIEKVRSEAAEPQMEWETALFALEDIIGGHSAVGHFLVKVFGYVVQDDTVQARIYEEIESVMGDNGSVQLGDRNQMPYTEAVIMEALRLIASPIVPHVANQNSTIGGYGVEKDTLIFLNNYELSMSPQLWTVDPTRFVPERFLRDGRFVKPDFFLPFGAGRRSCMGYKLVQMLSFSILTTIVQHFRLAPCGPIRIAAGSLAVSEQSFEFKFFPRRH